MRIFLTFRRFFVNSIHSNAFALIPPARHILLLLLLGAGTGLSAQNPGTAHANHWFFGYGSGLDFSNGAPVADTNGLQKSIEACVSMSDANGDLLFYGSHDTLYTADHQFMPNGDLENGLNPSQMLAVPKPGSDSLYYVFYSPQHGNIPSTKFAIIDMSLNGGMGEVISKNQVMLQGSSSNRVTEKVAAVRHCNGEDVWIHAKHADSTGLTVHLLSDTGLSSTPVVSNIGNPEHGFGHFSFSPNGNFAASALIDPVVYQSCDERDSIGLYRFDDCTGQFSDPVTLSSKAVYGLSFSPDNSKLYVGAGRTECLSGGAISIGDLVQYDLEPYDKDSILASRTVIAQGPYYFDAMQLGPDGRLYVQDVDTTTYYDTAYSYLGVVQYPDSSGQACSFQMDAVHCGRSDFLMVGLPSFDAAYFNGLKPEPSGVVEKGREKEELRVYPVPSKGRVHIQGLEKLAYRLEVYDPKGRRVALKEFHSGREGSIDLSRLDPGIYFIRGVPASPHQRAFNHKIVMR